MPSFDFQVDLLDFLLHIFLSMFSLFSQNFYSVYLRKELVLCHTLSVSFLWIESSSRHHSDLYK